MKELWQKHFGVTADTLSGKPLCLVFASPCFVAGGPPSRLENLTPTGGGILFLRPADSEGLKTGELSHGN